MAAPVFESYSIGVKNTGTSITITKPTGLSEGDLMLLFLIADEESGSFDADDPVTSGGWTKFDASTPEATSEVATAKPYYKVATSGDAAASNFSFATDNTSDMGGIICRISGGNFGDSLFQKSITNNSSGTRTITGITPTQNDTLLVMFGISLDVIGSDITSYAIATNDPTWTEQFDTDLQSLDSEVGMRVGLATATRTDTTATGNATFSITGATTSSDSIQYFIGITPIVDATISPTTVVTTATVVSPTITTNSILSVSTLSINTTINSPTITAEQNKWTNESKTSSSWTELNKS